VKAHTALQAEAAIPARDLTQVLVVIILWAICYPLITTGLAAFPPFHFTALCSFLAGASLPGLYIVSALLMQGDSSVRLWGMPLPAVIGLESLIGDP